MSFYDNSKRRKSWIDP